jgi:hypothetical protein
MRFMMIVKATKDSEESRLPSPQIIEAMGKYNEQMARAGVLLAAEGLHSSSSGTCISYPIPGGNAKLTNGPFADAKELIAGFTLIEVKSREEAIEWAFRMPDPHGFGDGRIELRQVKDTPDHFF